MFKKIWQSFVRWFRKLFGGGKATSRIPATELPPLDDTDREYLFMQLLEGVAHGWQQPRAIGFFNKIRQRVRKSEWLEWLDKFGRNLLDAPVANYELAGRMVQLGQLDCGEIGDLAGDYGAQLLDRQAEAYPNLLPIMEFSDLESENEDGQVPFDLQYGSSIESPDWNFDEVPLELLANNDASLASQSTAFAHQPEGEHSDSQTREITLEEFSAMLHNDPGLVAELAEQFGIETTDPQIIINTVVAQMQQQVQQISGDLTPAGEINPPTPAAPPAPPTVPTPTPEVPTPVPTAPPEIPAPQPEVPTPVPTAPPEIPAPQPEVPVTPSAPPEIPAPPAPAPSPAPEAHTPTSPAREIQAPPPPPQPTLVDYNSEDPWSNNLLDSNEEKLPKIANLPDRRGV
jgi:hypothetical protein